MNEEEAIDILKNCIADYVIGEYCSKCEDSQICESKNEDCYYLQSIDAVLNLLEKKDKESHFIQSELDIANAKIIELNKMIDLMAEELVKAHEWFYSEFDNYTKEDFIKYFERKVENGN